MGKMQGHIKCQYMYVPGGKSQVRNTGMYNYNT